MSHDKLASELLDLMSMLCHAQQMRPSRALRRAIHRLDHLASRLIQKVRVAECPIAEFDRLNLVAGFRVGELPTDLKTPTREIHGCIDCSQPIWTYPLGWLPQRMEVENAPTPICTYCIATRFPGTKWPWDRDNE